MKNKTGLPLSLGKCFLQTLILLGFAEEQLPDLMSVDDPTEMRLLTYSSKGRAEAGFKSSGFYSQYKLPGYKYGEPLATWLEAVPIKMTLEEI